MAHTYKYPRPMVTVDVVAVAPGAAGSKVLLIERGTEPFKGRWALPGGFVRLDEELAKSAARELREETGIDAAGLEQIAAFGAVGRDPRGRTITVAFLTRLDECTAPRAGSDAANARWHELDDLPPMAFDHDAIVDAARQMI